MPRKLTPAEVSRKAAYQQIIQDLGQDQGALASRLSVRRECICKRTKGKQPVTVEALFALMLIAGLTAPEETLDDLM